MNHQKSMFDQNTVGHFKRATRKHSVDLTRLIRAGNPQFRSRLLASPFAEPMACKAPTISLRSPIRCAPVNAPILRCFAPLLSCRYASGLSKTTSKALTQVKKKKKHRTEFKNQSLRDGLQFSLCDAMRYLKPFRRPSSYADTISLLATSAPSK